jgi:hypothetical protein
MGQIAQIQGLQFCVAAVRLDPCDAHDGIERGRQLINPVQGAVNGVRIPLSGLIQINRQSRQRRAQIMRDICPQIAGLVLSIYNIINLTQKQGKLTWQNVQH